MQHRLLAAIATASLLAAFSAQANKGAAYVAPKAEPSYDRFTITGGALYMLPSMNGLDYAGFFQEVAHDTTSIDTQQIDRGYSFGYFIGLGYRFNEHYDVQASWAQLNTNNNDSATSCDTCSLASTAGFLSTYHDAATDEALNYQVFDGTLGQLHQFGENLMTRVFAGVRYARIEDNTQNLYTNSAFPAYPSSTFESYNSSFSGVGPELGFDLNYGLNEWFSIVGHFAGAFLIGNQESNSSMQQVVGGDTPFIDQYYVNSEDTTRMIPALDGKLGASFAVPFMSSKDRFVVEAGYEVDYYFDAMDQSTIIFGFSNHDYADVGFMGPYLNVSAKF